MKTKIIFFQFLFLLLLSGCNKYKLTPVHSGFISYTTDGNESITSRSWYPKGKYQIMDDVCPTKNILEKVSQEENIPIENITITEIKLRAVKVGPDLDSNDIPLPDVLLNSKVRYHREFRGSRDLALLIHEESTESRLKYKILDVNLVSIDQEALSSYQFTFEFNDLWDYKSYSAQLDLSFDYKYQIEE